MGLTGSRWGIILPQLASPFNIFLLKNFFAALPQEVFESAEMDGAGFLRTYASIIMPLSKPIIATVAVYAAVGAWNSWQDNYLLVTNPKLQTVQLILYNCINDAQRIADSMKNGAIMSPGTVTVSAESLRMATTVVAVLPVMLVYPFLQKYFVKGVMLGAVKG